MQARLVLSIGLAAIVVWGISATESQACSCVPPDLAYAHNNSDEMLGVFVRARRVVGHTAYHHAVVHRVYKGCSVVGDSVWIVTSASSASCGFPLAPGWWYLIEGNVETIGGQTAIRIHSCGYNTRMENLTPDQHQWLNQRESCCGDTCGCADGSVPVDCFLDPCQTATCPQGECTANYCGSCTAEFYDAQGYEVCTPCEVDEDCAPFQVCLDPTGGNAGMCLNP